MGPDRVERRQSKICPVRAGTVLCPRRHRRDLSPPLRPPEAETHPPNASMNVFLVDSHTLPRESWRCYFSTPQAATIPSSLLVIYRDVLFPSPTSVSSPERYRIL